MIQKLYLIGTLLIGSNLNAQFIGGENDGSDIASLNGSRLTGEIASFSVLYQGNSGDGHDAQGNQLVLASTEFKIYHGSSGDGFSQNSSTLTISGNNINNLYFGDSGDGHAQNEAQSILNGTDLSMLFTGNSGDGADYALLSSAFLQGFINDIFQGGNGDGFSSVLKPNNYLSGLMLTLFNGGNGDGFAVNTLTSALTLDLVEQLVKMDALVYPNPANHIVNIKPSAGLTITSVELFDISGKKYYTELSNINTLNVSNLSDGIYLLNIISESGVITKKIIVKK